MKYMPLDALRRARVAQSDALDSPFTELAAAPDAAIESLGGSDHARVAVALLLLGGGGTDECHALVTPLSWPDGTTFGGPPKPGSAAAAEATYAHALVHRREAWHPGEFGTGWHNSAFWYGSVGRFAANVELQHEMRRQAFRAAQTDEEVAWCDKNLFKQWAPKLLNGALNDALVHAREASPAARSRSRVAFAEFAQRLALLELSVLLDHCLFRCADARTGSAA